MKLNNLFIGFVNLNWQSSIMILVGLVLIWLAIKKEYEPLLLLPIGFGTILVNLPLSVALEHENVAGFLKILFDAGITTELFPILIFIAFATILGFDFKVASAIGIIGAADGPTAIYVASRFAKEYLGPISVAAYSHMALGPLIQPVVIRALTTKNEKKIKMKKIEKFYNRSS